ncbi:uncharacterized protein LY89DRAFT_238762 [Mollisia scopiformis]|uniref:2EXR domain-containing protein n=1 Tax=Mollisia scopiformis TaxID=149040 RepID=A0A194WT81_MOLSC|nr:uncharacterized protein LY89DRAFT_238762 [Mollisia scopiformis]KUJ11161.1 hypothetical protein LY89DRAFT_238762 [Mollisia scopiformis]
MTTSSFMGLPVEMRLQIWNYILKIPRVVTIDYDPNSEDFTRAKLHQTTPVLLHVCRESRALAFPRYGSVFTPTNGREYTGCRGLNVIERLLHLLTIDGPATAREKRDA